MGNSKQAAPAIPVDVVDPSTGEVYSSDYMLKRTPSGRRYTQHDDALREVEANWPATQVKLASYIADHMSWRNLATVSVSTVARDTGLSRPTIIKYLRLLEIDDFVRPATDDKQLGHYYMVNPMLASRTDTAHRSQLMASYAQLHVSCSEQQIAAIDARIADIDRQIARLEQQKAQLVNRRKAAQAKTEPVKQ